MYYPKQIPYLLDKIFKDNVKYTEYHFEELENYCMCIWKMQSKEILDKPIYKYILPDRRIYRWNLSVHKLKIFNSKNKKNKKYKFYLYKILHKFKIM